MPTARFQPSFAAGVLGPGLHGRIDIAKYDVALKVGVNVIVHSYGGVSNRPGTEFIAEVPDSSKAHRLLPFTRDDTENFVMLMGDSTMRIIQNGAVLQSGGVDYAPVTPYPTAALADLAFVQSIDVMYMAHQTVFPQKMSRASALSWTFANMNIDPTLTSPGAPSVSAALGSSTETYKYKVAPVTGGIEGFPSAAGTVNNAQPLANAGQKITVSWTSTGADEYKIYRERNGIYGYIGFTDKVSFVDDNISNDLTETPVEAAALFSTANDYPGVVSMFQQRLVFANSVSQPETIWMSRVGDFANYTRSRVMQDDDRVEMDITGSTVNRVRSMAQLRDLVVFTSGGEFTVTGPNGVMLATNPIQTQQGYAGSTTTQPLTVDDTLLFVDRTGRTVRDLRYKFADDGFSGNDLTIFAQHFFEGKSIARWAYQKSPGSIIWVALDDGTLLSLTYRREHQVWAWTEHNVGGLVEDVTAIPEGNEDAVYMIVRRTINGATKRYVERLHTRVMADVTDAFFVDSGLTYSGAPATVMSGLAHLEGETLVGLADGAVVTGLTVNGGSVTLPYAASKVHLGLGFTARIETLPPAMELQGTGSSRGRPIKSTRVFLQLKDTRGIEVGATEARLTPLLQSAADLSVVRPLFTGMDHVNVYPEWNRDGTIVVKQTYPLPFTVLGVSPELSVGR